MIGRATSFALVLLAALLTLAEPPEVRGADRVPRGSRAEELSALLRSSRPDATEVRNLSGLDVIGANDLARLLDATKFWRPALRKLELRSGPHRIQFTADNPFVLVDDTTVLMPGPIQSIQGELQVPVALIESLPRDSSLAQLVFHRGQKLVFRVPRAGLVRSPSVAVAGRETRITFPLDRPDGVRVASRSRAHFVIKTEGLFVGDLPSKLPAGLVRAFVSLPAVVGDAFELEIDPSARGFRLLIEPQRRQAVLLVTSVARAGFEDFAGEGPPGTRKLDVIVLDPGHGGDDPGVSVEGAIEKELTLQLALQLRAEIKERIGSQVVLTREEDRFMNVRARAERANQVRADLFLSLHFDGFGNASAHGVTAYGPPAVLGESGASGEGLGGRIDLVPWRDVAMRHAVLSRDLAESVLSAIELRGFGPTRWRETLPYPLLGVNAPGLMIECGTLTSTQDRVRLVKPGAMAELAATIVDGLTAYQRNP